MDNIFDLKAKLNSECELVDLLLEVNGIHNFRIERIVSKGYASAKDFWYNQDENEWVILIQGQAELIFENEPGNQLVRMPLSKGNYLFIPKHQKHRVEYTSTEPECIWLAIFIK